MIPSNSKSWQYNASHGIFRTATRRSAFGPRKPDTSRAIHSRLKLQVQSQSNPFSFGIRSLGSTMLHALGHSIVSPPWTMCTCLWHSLILSLHRALASVPFARGRGLCSPRALLAGAGDGFVSVAIMDGSDKQALRKTPQQRYRGRRPAALARGSEHDQGVLGRGT